MSAGLGWEMASLLSSVGHGLGSAAETGDSVRVCGWAFCLDYTWVVPAAQRLEGEGTLGETEA